MNHLTQSMARMEEPSDYFRGVGSCRALPTPRNVLLFVRRSRSALQQKALGNRSHHRFVFLLCVETPGTVHLDHEQMRLEPGHALLISPYRFHHYSHLRSSKLAWVFCTFELEAEAWAREMPAVPVHLSSECYESFSDLCAMWCGQRVAPERLQLKLLEMLMRFRETGSGLEPHRLLDSQDNLLAAVNRVLAGLAGRTVQIRQVAEALEVSVPHLRHTFREISGVSLGRYLENYRLNRAVNLLNTGRTPVGEIALQAGYASPQAFHRAFRRLTGETPLGYRRRNRSPDSGPPGSIAEPNRAQRLVVEQVGGPALHMGIEQIVRGTEGDGNHG